MNPKCPKCGGISGVQRVEAGQPSGGFDPRCDLVVCVDCGVILSALMPLASQHELEVLVEQSLRAGSV